MRSGLSRNTCMRSRWRAEKPVRIPLDQPPAEVMKLIEGCDAVLLPGSKADIDPAKYKALPTPGPRPPIPRATP